MKVTLLFLVLLYGNYPATAQPGTTSQHAETGMVLLQFSHVVGNSRLYLDSSYSNISGESFSIHKLRYYISNIVFHNTNSGKQYKVSERYFLINEAEAASKKLSLIVQSGQYNMLSFLLGVDSLRNVSGAQTGALDPLNDMFWTWNTGYVMAKLEGSSPVSKLPHHLIEYHIGGFRGAHAVLQTVKLQMQKGKSIRVTSKHTTNLQLRADIGSWFSGKHVLAIAEQPACTSPGPLAVKFSENYATMFSFQNIQNP